MARTAARLAAMLMVKARFIHQKIVCVTNEKHFRGSADLENILRLSFWGMQRSVTQRPVNMEVRFFMGSTFRQGNKTAEQHGIKGFVTPTKSFVKIGITNFFYTNKMFSSINKKFGCCSEIFGCSNKKKMFVVPNFVAVTKPFFPVNPIFLTYPEITSRFAKTASKKK